MGALNTIATMAASDIRNFGLLSRRNFTNGLSDLLGDTYLMQNVRGRLWKMAGARVELGVRMRAPVHVEVPGNLSIGAGSFLNREAYLDNTSEKIQIGKNVIIGFRVSMTTSDHDILTREIVGKPIVIEDDVWIGAGCIILPGVTVGAGAVVASGAVVAGDVSPHTVVGGVPARTIKRIENDLCVV